MKRTGILLLVLALVLGCFGCNTKKEQEAADKANKASEELKKDDSLPEFEYDVKSDGLVLTKYNGSKSYVEIPEEIDAQPVVRIKDTTFKNNNKIEKVYIPYTVQSIDEDTFPVDADIQIQAYRNTMGDFYASYRHISFEDMGENLAQAPIVEIYDETGKTSEKIKLGDEGTMEHTKGIEFKQQDQKSVLKLNGVHIGAILAEARAALTIELVEGTESTVIGMSGLDGIYCGGNLTICGKGSLMVQGSDEYSLREGDDIRYGVGIYASGTVSIEETGRLVAKAGTSKFGNETAIIVNNGDIRIKNANVEAFCSEADENGSSTAIMAMADNHQQAGNIVLENTVIAEGGQIIEMQDDMGGCFGHAIGSAGAVTLTEGALYTNFMGASHYVRIEKSVQ